MVHIISLHIGGGGENRLPCDPQWYCEISSGSETETRSVTPVTKRAAARKDSGCDLSPKARVYGCKDVSITLVDTQRTDAPCP
jgi:hypothetical protein